MKTLFGILIGVMGVALVAPAHAQTLVYDSQVMREVVDHYCRDTQPVSSCGLYQTDIDFAQTRAAQLVGVVGAQPAGQQAILIEGMMERVARSFYTATDPRQKLVSAWYYLYFNQKYTQLNTNEIGQLTDILYGYDELDPLFTVTDQVRYDTRPYVQTASQVITQPTTYTTSYTTTAANNSGGSIRSVNPLKGSTRISGSTLIPSGRASDIDLRIHTWAGSKAASKNTGYRVVATTRSTGNKVFAANYKSNGNWELRMRPSSNIGNLTIYLLCQSCTSGTEFTKGSNYYGWKIVDTKAYSVGYDRALNRYTTQTRYDYDRFYDRYDDDYDYRSFNSNPYSRKSYDYYYDGNNSYYHTRQSYNRYDRNRSTYYNIIR